MHNLTNRRGEVDGFVVAVFCIFVASLVFYFLGRQHGHEQGVRDALDGLYVIDTLSDGTTVVVKKKGANDAK